MLIGSFEVVLGVSVLLVLRQLQCFDDVRALLTGFSGASTLKFLAIFPVFVLAVDEVQVIERVA